MVLSQWLTGEGYNAQLLAFSWGKLRNNVHSRGFLRDEAGTGALAEITCCFVYDHFLVRITCIWTLTSRSISEDPDLRHQEMFVEW